MKRTILRFKFPRHLILGIMIVICASWTMAQQLAFPTAEGYGKFSNGGRGGNVYEVTTLNASGSGSLGEAISASGPRTVVFKVAGTITGNFKISNDFLTIAGQTAPGDGICIKGSLSLGASDLIIRYIRVRPNASGDAITGGSGCSRVILDHISCSWSSDEVFSVYRGNNVTFQYCLISEPCGNGHNFGGIWGNEYSTYHHNLFAHTLSRTPRWASNFSGHNDYRNNVNYNWGYNNCYGGTSATYVNMVANYYKPGPATESGVANQIADPNSGRWYVAENFVVGSPEVTNDNWKGMTGGTKLNAPWPAMPFNQQTAEDAYITVLDEAGCSFPTRDALDVRIIEEVRTGTAKFGNNGIINSPGEVGGWPNLASGTPYTDNDHDGMADSWETANGLNPSDASDRNDIGAGGYTMLEIFINSFVDVTTPVKVTGVSVSPTSTQVGIGSSVQLTAKVEPSNATNKNVSWSSSNTSVATVSQSGIVAGIAKGSAVITVKTQDGGFTATSIITVSNINVPVTGVTVSPGTASVGVGKTTQLTATVSPSNATNKAVSWSSGNSSVATVSQSGVVTGVSKGSAVITVKTQDGGYTASSQITVSDESSYCNNPKAISIPFVKEGAGDFCWSTTKKIAYINSWNLEELTINGEDFTNAWSDKLPPAQNGQWVIHYVGKYDWSHFEAAATKNTVPMAFGTEKGVRIYPNPFKEGLNIDLSRCEGAKRIEVINSMGQVVKTLEEGQVQEGLIKLRTESGPGLYLIRIYTEEGIVSEVIVKE